MSRFVPAATLLVLVPALSGCLSWPFDLAFDQADEGDVTLDDTWVPVLDRLGPYAGDAIGFYVPPAAMGVRVSLPTTIVGGEGMYASSWGPSDHHLHRYEARIVLYGPDGEIVPLVRNLGADIVTDGESGNETPSGDQPEPTSTTSVGVGTTVATNETTLHLDLAPRNGTYVFVRYGSAPLPKVELLSNEPLEATSFFALPTSITWQHVASNAATTMPGTLHEGDIDLPKFPLTSWGELSGTAADVRLSLATTEGVVHVRQTELLFAPNGKSYPSEPRTFFGDASADDPRALRGHTLHFQASGTGLFDAFVYEHAAHSIRAPLATPYMASGPAGSFQSVSGSSAQSQAMPAGYDSSSSSATTDQGGPGDDVAVPLAGSVDGGQAAIAIAPEGAAVQIIRDDNGRDRLTPYRLYDLTGSRLAWSTLASGGHDTWAVPAGPLLIINDGFDDLSVAVVGADPVDATLHEVSPRERLHRQSLDASAGPARSLAYIDLPGPVAEWSVGPSLTEHHRLEITLTDDEDTLRGQIPSVGMLQARRQAFCCTQPWDPFFGQYAGGHWLDGGTYEARVAAEAGQGELSIRFVTYDLVVLRDQFFVGDADDLGADTNDTDAGDDGPYSVDHVGPLWTEPGHGTAAINGHDSEALPPDDRA